MTITLRSTKGSALTYEEADENFAELDYRTKPGWRMVSTTGSVLPGDALAANLSIFKGNIYLYNYIQGQTSQSFTDFDVPLDHAPGTDLWLALHWSSGSSSSIGSVRWGIEYSFAYGYDTGAFGETQTVYLSETTNGTPYFHYTTFNNSADKIPGSVVQPNMRFILRVFRDGSNPADTFDGDAYLVGVDFFYKADRLGPPELQPPFTYETF